MEIILKEYVKGLGEKGDLVSVKNGYGRNFLIPKKLGVLATVSARKQVEENMKQAAHKAEHLRQEASNLKDKLEAIVLRVATLAGVDGKLFGSVTSLMIENQLKDQGFVIDRKRIHFTGDMKELGEYTVTIDVLKDVKADLKIEVVAKEA